MKTWKSPTYHAVSCPNASTLQWGHGDEDVEENPKFRNINLKLQLQWGHVDEDVEENRRLPFVAPGLMGFNGATSMKTWKGSQQDRSQQVRDRFNGATSMKTWKRPPNSLANSSACCFNGATSMKTWKRSAADSQQNQNGSC